MVRDLNNEFRVSWSRVAEISQSICCYMLHKPQSPESNLIHAMKLNLAISLFYYEIVERFKVFLEFTLTFLRLD